MPTSLWTLLFGPDFKRLALALRIPLAPQLLLLLLGAPAALGPLTLEPAVHPRARHPLSEGQPTHARAGLMALQQTTPIRRIHNPNRIPANATVPLPHRLSHTPPASPTPFPSVPPHPRPATARTTTQIQRQTTANNGAIPLAKAEK